MLGFNPIASAPLASGPLVEALRVFQVKCLQGTYNPIKLMAGLVSSIREVSGRFSPERNLTGNIELCDDEE